MKTAILNIDGMMCGGCVKTVERVILGVDAVASVDVDWQQGRARVQFDGAKVDEQSLLSALIHELDEAGYEARI